MGITRHAVATSKAEGIAEGRAQAFKEAAEIARAFAWAAVDGSPEQNAYRLVAKCIDGQAIDAAAKGGQK